MDLAMTISAQIDCPLHFQSRKPFFEPFIAVDSSGNQMVSRSRIDFSFAKLTGAGGHIHARYTDIPTN